jgi:hypothetical protein
MGGKGREEERKNKEGEKRERSSERKHTWLVSVLPFTLGTKGGSTSLRTIASQSNPLKYLGVESQNLERKELIRETQERIEIRSDTDEL